jgi:hypothetical protein
MDVKKQSRTEKIKKAKLRYAQNKINNNKMKYKNILWKCCYHEKY